MPEYRFRCSECDATMLVDEAVRPLVVEEGCAVCGAVPDQGAFAPVGTDEE